MTFVFDLRNKRFIFCVDYHSKFKGLKIDNKYDGNFNQIQANRNDEKMKESKISENLKLCSCACYNVNLA